MKSNEYFQLKESLADSSDTASFYLTARRCEKPKQGEQPDFDEVAGWSARDQDIVVCHGLAQLEQLLEMIDDSVCLYPGFPVPSEIFSAHSEVRPWENLVERFYYELLGQNNDSDFAFPEERTLLCFEVNSDSPLPEDAWEQLCSVDPQLKGVGYFLTTYPIRYGDHDRPSYRYRFYCVADDGSDLPQYRTAFMVKSNLLYQLSFDTEEDGYSYIKQWINPFNMTADCQIHGRDYLSVYGDYETSLKSGGILKTSALECATKEEWSRLSGIVDKVLENKRAKTSRRKSRS